ncbi:MAG TPA: helix-turn-helix domain-containing protein [Pseudonocardia sp.]|jgi:excisionase family DNA binding protein|uniref:helix-turn-helix domain-containing protein n=1 Tax=Pseudonocardia sp. TaxID=60912 RepID=UPI002B4AD134|nr:helix-turn-helix domain-containing protein [Pseudonocardia sp.]HLU54354.1 helix-turn-helix domain-containing protein [Pseudonocardia sp.]
MTQLYSVEEVAALLGLHVKTVRSYVHDGKLDAVRIGRRYRIPAEALEAFTGRAVAPPRRGAAVEVSSVVQIDDVDRALADRISTLVVSSLGGAPNDDGRLRVESSYDPARSRLKLIVLGGPQSTAELLRLVGALVEDRS